MELHQGIDCVSKITKAKARLLREMGIRFVARYLVPAIYGKALTRTEAENISEAGMNILCCWETAADRVKGGAANGHSDGSVAADLARRLAVPKGATVYFAVDYDAGEGDFRAITAYLTAAQAQLRPDYNVGVYGSARVIDAVHALMPTCKGFWQCVAWSYGRIAAPTGVYQAHWQDAPESKAIEAKLGFAVDIDYCSDMDGAGMWSYRTEEETMTGEEIYKALRDYCAAKPVPSWAKAELEEAKALGITDGTNPTQLIPRYQAAIMALRAAKAAQAVREPEDEKTDSGLLSDE